MQLWEEIRRHEEVRPRVWRVGGAAAEAEASGGTGKIMEIDGNRKRGRWVSAERREFRFPFFL
jgi:hypothetical protein